MKGASQGGSVTLKPKNCLQILPSANASHLPSGHICMGIPCLCYQPGNSQTFHLYHVETSYPFQRRVTLLLWLFDTIPMPLVACKLKSNSNRSSKLLAMELHLSHNPCYSTAGDTRKASTKQAFKSSFVQCICKNQHNHKD